MVAERRVRVAPARQIASDQDDACRSYQSGESSAQQAIASLPS